MTFLTSIEQSDLGVWMRQSPSMFAYTGMISVHALGLAMAVGFSWVLALRVLGVANGIPLAPLKALIPLVWVGFWLCAFSGTMLLVGSASRDLSSPIFLTKLTFVGVGAYATTVLKRLLPDTLGQATSVAEASPQLHRQAKIVLAVWTLAIMAGRINEYPQLLGFKYH